MMKASALNHGIKSLLKELEFRRLRQNPVKYVIVHWIFGVSTGVLCASLLLAFNVANLRELIWRSDIALPALALLYAGFSVTFGSVVCGAAIMSLGQGANADGSGKKKLAIPAPARAAQAQPARVAVRVRSTPRERL